VADAGAHTQNATALRSAQSAADELLRRATNAQHALDDAEARRNTASSRFFDLPDTATEDDHRAAQLALTGARTAVSDADAALDRARSELEQVVADRDRAARVAMDKIDGAVGHDGLNDGWWQNWGADVAAKVSQVAGTIAAVAGIASLFLGWVPILGQVLVVTALVAGAAAFAADVAVAATGEQDWTNAIIGGIGLLTFGAGRALGAGVRGFQAATTSAGSRAAAAALRSGNPAVRAASRTVPRQLAAARNPWPGAPAAFRNGLRPGFQRLRADTTELRNQIRALPTKGDRMLARSGSPELITGTVAARASANAAQASAAPALLAAAQRGQHLQLGSALLYSWGATSNYGILGGTLTGLLEPEPSPSETLDLVQATP
jgi:hypothetical protein